MSEYLRARAKLDDPDPKDADPYPDGELIPDCEWCGCAGYLCACDWLADDDIDFQEAA